jgi:hypothetical protein
LVHSNALLDFGLRISFQSVEEKNNQFRQQFISDSKKRAASNPNPSMYIETTTATKNMENQSFEFCVPIPSSELFINSLKQRLSTQQNVQKLTNQDSTLKHINSSVASTLDKRLYSSEE